MRRIEKNAIRPSLRGADGGSGFLGGAARNEQAIGMEHATIECCEPFFQEKEAPASRPPTPRKPLFYVGSEKLTGYSQPVFLLCAESKKTPPAPR